MAILETDPLDILLTEDNDLIIHPELGITFVSGLEAVGQLVRIAMRLFKGEWFLDEELGVPYFEDILGEKFAADVIRDRLVKQIKTVTAVIDVPSFGVTWNPTTRKADVTGDVLTEFGTLTISEEI